MTTFVVLAVLILLLLVENYQTYREEHPQKQKRMLRSYVTNLLLMVFGDTMMSFLSVSSLVFVVADYSEFGILKGETGIIPFVVSLILFDMTLYVWHLQRHRFRFLWRFHQTHHSDVVMNTTTAFRLHFVEIFFTTLVKSVFVLVVGVSADFVLLNEMIAVICAMFHHADISFRGEKWASCFMVMPYTHRVHHSTEKGEHHRNFGTIFSVWDRFFGTLKKAEPEELGQKDLGEQGFLDILLLLQKEK